MTTTPAPPTTLLQATAHLHAEAECLCESVSTLTAAIGALTESLELLRHRQEQIWGQLNRLELWLATQSGYPRTQADVPGASQVYARILADAQAGER